MITEKELHEAIAECQGQRNPNANTCIKLASFYTILDHLYNNEEKEEKRETVPSYSFALPPELTYDSGTEFSDKIHDMNIDDVLAVMDELMATLSVVNPRLYASVMRKLEG